MSSDNRKNAMDPARSGSGRNGTMPEISFFEELDKDTLKVVELIITTSTGRKPVFAQQKLIATT